MTVTGVQFAHLDWRGEPLRLEYQWVGPAASARPVVVFLHEGLGSLAMWKDFPAAFCAEHSFRGLVFSRHGYGQSTPKPSLERWPPSFMHIQAHEALPLLFDALGVDRPWLFGHSDGASIALLYASRFAVAGVVAVAPHVFVESVTIASIERAREAYDHGDLRARLARYHADPDSAFRGWNDVWLDAAFRDWNIEAELGSITAPILAIQGEDDEYGSLEQIRRILRRLPKAERLVLPRCGHAPHRDQPATLSLQAARFIRQDARLHRDRLTAS